ncbi:hypothetical protein MHN80_02250 [Gordonia McavH-238-E]|uniref:hypothetical protein n=1 Tax=Gordonia sp. McavH-238-E TaxID=2917736 RepID=UPI001EF44AC2|nr:hypothetical protein [Gordonia sp. McavH-238-E]MCG7631125.1 hypothetical protein [Gordonia sp. McavH-238-E]
MANPIGSFWTEVSTADWVANVGVPVSATLTALAFAFFALRSQLNQERALAAEDRKRSAATKLAERIRAATEEMDLFFTPAAVETDINHETIRWVGGHHFIRFELQRAIAATRNVVGNSTALEQISDFLPAMSSRWTAAGLCGQMCLAEGYTIDRVLVAMHTAIGTDKVILSEIAWTLDTWNGAGEIPSIAHHLDQQRVTPAPKIGDPLPDGSPSPGKLASDAWHAERLAEFRGFLDPRYYVPKRTKGL